MRAPSWLGPLLLAAFGAGLVVWSWEKWADVYIDFGAELYAAWRLAEGDALYRDLAYRHGPLPHYLNALWFTLFGVSIRTLALCNLAVLAGIAGLCWGICRRACGSWVASATTAVLLGVFAFGHQLATANYNFVTPYHHHQTHGLALGLGMIAAFCAAWRRGDGLRWYALAGLCLGGVFLTKLELFVPAAAAAALALAVTAGVARDARLAAGATAAGALALPLGFGVALAARMDPGLALTGVLGNWAHLGYGVLDDPFYRQGMGLDDPLGNAGTMLGAALGLALFAAALVGADRLASAGAERLLPGGRARVPLAVAAGLGLFALLVAYPDLLPWRSLARALPLAASAIGALLLMRLWRGRREREVLLRWGPPALFAVFAVALLAKMVLNARFEHYGFALAMPATLLLVAALFELARRAPGRGDGALALAVVTGVVAAGVVFFLDRSHEFYRRKDFAVGQGSDRVVSYNPYTSQVPRRVGEALGRLEALMPPDSTLLVLPEGASLNYWLRKRNPTGYMLFLPTEIATFGETAMLDRLRESPPDFVALVHRHAAEFGTGPFGVDPRFGRALLTWIGRHYRRVARVGAEPFGEGGFGIAILRRREGSADSVP